jgi:ribosomal subunit interface protein
MQTPLRLTFRRLGPTPGIVAYVRRRADKLEKLCARITGCHVAIETPHRRKSHGHHYRVRIDLSVPGDEIAVTRLPDAHVQNEDLYAAIDDAFDRAARVLRDSIRRRREREVIVDFAPAAEE